MSEDQLLEAVLDAAKVGGWLVHHDRPARTADGDWRTPVQGDKGFPDLVLVHHQAGVLFRELKSATGRPSPTQREWIASLKAAGADVDVWRPCDWTNGSIAAVLIGHRMAAR